MFNNSVQQKFNVFNSAQNDRKMAAKLKNCAQMTAKWPQNGREIKKLSANDREMAANLESGQPDTFSNVGVQKSAQQENGHHTCSTRHETRHKAKHSGRIHTNKTKQSIKHENHKNLQPN